MEKQGPLEAGAKALLDGINKELGLDINDENFYETPTRVARMYKEILSGVTETDQQVKEILASAFPCDNDQLVLIKDIEAFSLCPHHLLPVHYKIHVAYIPNGKVIGLSKLGRLVDVLAKRPVLQEQLVSDVTSNLMRINGTLGAACVAEGRHYCMLMRGVKQSHATTVTSSTKGAFRQSPAARQELMELIRR